jgi:hypothetical protein
MTFTLALTKNVESKEAHKERKEQPQHSGCPKKQMFQKLSHDYPLFYSADLALMSSRSLYALFTFAKTARWRVSPLVN